MCTLSYKGHYTRHFNVKRDEESELIQMSPYVTDVHDGTSGRGRCYERTVCFCLAFRDNAVKLSNSPWSSPICVELQQVDGFLTYCMAPNF